MLQEFSVCIISLEKFNDSTLHIKMSSRGFF